MVRQFNRLIERTWNEKILFSVMFELTYHCNLNCFYCYNDTTAAGRLLAVTQYETMLNDLKNLGTMHLTLSGGEPLLSPHFFTIGSKAREHGFVVRIKSNGHTLQKEIARKVKKEIDPYIIEMSLHGSCSETHDRQTRVPGSFNQLMANMDDMCNAGLRLQLNSALTAWNEKEIPDMFAIADKLGVPLMFDYRVTPRDDGDRAPLAITPSQEGIKRLLQCLFKRSREGQGTDKIAQSSYQKTKATRQKGRHHCGAGSGSLVIDPFGNVYPCVQWRHSVGNLHEKSIKQIWSTSSKLDRVRRITEKVKTMVEAEGEAARLSGFCPALAEQLSGIPVEFDPGTKSYIKLIKELDLDTTR